MALASTEAQHVDAHFFIIGRIYTRDVLTDKSAEDEFWSIIRLNTGFNRAYSYSQYWTRTSLQWRLAGGVVGAENAHAIIWAPSHSLRRSLTRTSTRFDYLF